MTEDSNASADIVACPQARGLVFLRHEGVEVLHSQKQMYMNILEIIMQAVGWK